MGPVPTSNVSAAVLDASFLVGFCAKESNKFPQIKTKLDYYAANGWLLFAPGVTAGEVMYALCKKRTEDGLSDDDYRAAVNVFATLMSEIHPTPGGEASLIGRAEQIHQGYGCSRMSDAFYLALTERLQSFGTAELATTDHGMKTQAHARAPLVRVDVLPVTP
jgi:predicted nucleic acid-binding protein